MFIQQTIKELFRDYRFLSAFIVLCLLIFLAVLSAFSPYDPSFWFTV
ncbi:MAG TPA: peptide ABC transporter, partial [Firmicutes bacterium]|nr:peptide ABC transporter [Bacillota bacterium]